VTVRFGVLPGTQWRWHIDDPFDQFGFLDPRHPLVAALKFRARQAIAGNE
jgi:hypothetical protein